jgi:hypothetical protein
VHPPDPHGQPIPPACTRLLGDAFSSPISPRLSVAECREILGIPELTDEQVAEIRDTLYGFARVFLDEFLRERRHSPVPPRTPR